MNEEETKKFEKPDDYFKIKVNGEPRELFMSAGMLRILTALISELDDYSAIYTDPAMQERCLVELLVNRDRRGKPIEIINEEEILIDNIEDISLLMFNMAPDDCSKLIKWMGDHSIYFFIEGAMNMTDLVEKQGKSLQNLMHSLDGSKT